MISYYYLVYIRCTTDEDSPYSQAQELLKIDTEDKVMISNIKMYGDKSKFLDEQTTNDLQFLCTLYRSARSEEEKQDIEEKLLQLIKQVGKKYGTNSK